MLSVPIKERISDMIKSLSPTYTRNNRMIILLEDINKILSEGIKVNSYLTQDEIQRADFTEQWTTSNKFKSTHSAMLIDIQPIVRQTREEKLEELVEELATYGTEKGADIFYYATKAKALLGESE